MTYKKALNDLKRQAEHWENGTEFSYSLPPLKVAIKALEKQIPKKPTHEASLYKCLTCQTCKNVIDEFTEFIPGQPKIRVKTIHCKFCGQALDWGDTEQQRRRRKTY
jgi:hypothetical protein